MANIENNKNKETENLILDEINTNVSLKNTKPSPWWSKFITRVFWFFLAFILLFFILINLPFTKNYIAQIALDELNKAFKTEIKSNQVEVNFFGDVIINDLKIKDHKGLDFIKTKSLKASSDWFALAFNTNDIKFNSLSLNEADIKIITYKGEEDANFIKFVDKFSSGKSSGKVFKLKSRISIINSKLSIINENIEGEAKNWLNATNLNLKIPELKVIGPEVFARVNNFSFDAERWGKKYQIKTFSTEFALTKEALDLKGLTFETDKSLLQGEINFKLDKETKWQDFNNKVKLNLEINKGSQLSGYDLNYFVTDWDNEKAIALSGKMSGFLNQFQLENFQISNDKLAINTKSLKASNLLKGDFVIETNQLSTDLTYIDLKAMLPTFISSKMKNFADDFGRIKYSGAVKVTPKEVFVQKADLITGIGQVRISNFYLNDFSTDLPKFRGFADVSNLNTSIITKNNQVGLLSGKFNLEGQSFDVNKMLLKTKSEVSKIEILGKEINNIYLDGVLNHKTYKGIANINDEQAKAKVNGFFDFSTNNLKADLLADISHLNLSYFTDGKKDQILSGVINTKVSMTSLNDLILNASLKSVDFATSSQKFNIPDGNLEVSFENGNRVVHVNAPGVIDGGLFGKFNLSDIAGITQNAMDKILAGKTSEKKYPKQSFTFNFNIEQALISYFEPNLKLPEGAKVTGNFDGNSNNFSLNANASTLKYLMTSTIEISEADKTLALANPSYKVPEKDLIKKDSALVDEFSLKINTADLAEQITANIGRIAYDNNIFKDINLHGRNENDEILHISTDFKLGSPEEEKDGKLNSYAIGLDQTINSEGDYVIKFEPTIINLNKVAWAIDTDPELNHSITYRKKTKDFLVENLRIFSDNSALLVKNAIFKSAKDFSASGEVENFEISKILALTKSENSVNLTGLANGSFQLEMDKSNLKPIIDLNVEDIILNGQEMGNIVIDAKNSDTPNVFDITAKILSSDILGNNVLTLAGTVNNNTKSPSLNLVANMDGFDLAFAEEFIKTVFGNIRGKATGNLNISGTLEDPDYSGNIALKDFGLKLLFTGVDYSFDDTVVQILKGVAVLNDVSIKDGRTNSSGSISGVIQFPTLASMGVNLVMRADNLILLDTQQKDFDLFWGRIYGRGDLFVDGPVSALNISTPNMKALNNSTFTFNSNSTSSVDEFKMLRFLEQDDTGILKVKEREKYGANMNIDFTLDVDKGTTVNVLVGDDIGDISVRGTADQLKFNLTRSGNVSINGKYLVDSGTYLSKLFVTKEFQIQKNSNIEWYGNALAPVLDIKANYIKTVTNAGDYLGIPLQPINVMLTTKISNTLSNPEMDFIISAQGVSSQINETLAEKTSQKDENIKQFGYILAFNSFLVQNSAGGFGLDNIGSGVVNQGYGLVLKQLGSVFNDINKKINVDFDYVGSNSLTNTGSRASTKVSYSISPRWNVSSSFGIPISKADNTANNYFSFEGSLEHDFSKKNDGSRLVRIYTKPNNIGFSSDASAINPRTNQSYGAGIVYSKSFNSILKRTKKDKKTTDKTSKIKKDSLKKDTLK